jgi:hypothetical protein
MDHTFYQDDMPASLPVFSATPPAETPKPIAHVPTPEKGVKDTYDEYPLIDSLARVSLLSVGDEPVPASEEKSIKYLMLIAKAKPLDSLNQKRAVAYAYSVRRDYTAATLGKANQDAMRVLQTRGGKAFVDHAFTCEATGRNLTYSEMRERYG